MRVMSGRKQQEVVCCAEKPASVDSLAESQLASAQAMYPRAVVSGVAISPFVSDNSGSFDISHMEVFLDTMAVR